MDRAQEITPVARRQRRHGEPLHPAPHLNVRLVGNGASEDRHKRRVVRAAAVLQSVPGRPPHPHIRVEHQPVERLPNRFHPLAHVAGAEVLRGIQTFCRILAIGQLDEAFDLLAPHPLFAGSEDGLLMPVQSFVVARYLSPRFQSLPRGRACGIGGFFAPACLFRQPLPDQIVDLLRRIGQPYQIHIRR